MIRNSELWGGLFWFAVGAYVIYAGRDMGLGGLHEPGSGFAFYWVGILMCALAASVIGQAVVTGGPTLASLWAGTRWPKVLLIVASLAAYATVLDVLGFLVATVPLMLVLLRGIDPVRWRTALPIAALSTLGVWWVLKRLLLIQLPAGIFEIG